MCKSNVQAIRTSLRRDRSGKYGTVHAKTRVFFQQIRVLFAEFAVKHVIKIPAQTVLAF